LDTPLTFFPGRIQWHDGELTKAFCGGEWLLLDNINQAEASVLERLNPVMEEVPHLVITENPGTLPHCLLSDICR
jgi:midasin (ATPase involved in ribosome maturation)